MRLGEFPFRSFPLVIQPACAERAKARFRGRLQAASYTSSGAVVATLCPGPSALGPVPCALPLRPVSGVPRYHSALPMSGLQRPS
jgi:hypothetical protein